MKKGLTYGVIFVIGAAIGSVVTWKALDLKYQTLAQDEIDSVKESFNRWKEELSLAQELATKAKEKTDVSEYATKLIDMGYRTDYFKANIDAERREESEEKDVLDSDILEPEHGIFVIPPDEFGEIDDYDTTSLFYYADGFLADEDNDLVIDLENTIGEDALDHFGEWEDDSVFVRNDILKIYYEILKDQRFFEEIIRVKKPHEED